MMKSLAASLVVAALTIGAVVALRKSSGAGPDHSAVYARMFDPSPAVRKAAVTEMFAKGDLVSTRALLTVAREEDADVRSTLDHAILTTSRKDSVAWLTGDALTYPDRWTRYYAVRVTSGQRGPEAIPLLLPHLADNYWQVQIAILDAIQQAGAAASAIDALAQAAAPGRNFEVRMRAISLLGDANSAVAARALLEKALPAPGQPADGEAERAVEEALARMTDGEAMKVVAESLGSSDLSRKLLAVKILGRGKSLEHLGKLQAIGTDASAPTPLRIAAIRAVVCAGAEEGVAFALKVLDSNEPALRLEAAYALSDVKLTPEAKASVKERAGKEQDWRVKQALQIASEDRE